MEEIFQYGSRTKWQYMQWKSPESCVYKKAKIIAFFNIWDYYCHLWVHSYLKIRFFNEVYYKKILKIIFEYLHQRKPSKWKNASGILHPDNVPPTLITFSVCRVFFHCFIYLYFERAKKSEKLFLTKSKICTEQRGLNLWLQWKKRRFFFWKT